MTPVPSNFPTGVPVCAPVPQRNGRDWYVDGVTWACYPNQARALGTTENHMADLVPFETKRKATAAWLALHHAPKAFTVGQEVWLGKTSARVLACTYTHAVVLYSDKGMPVKKTVLLGKIQARGEVA